MHVKKGMPDVDLKSIAGAFVTRSMDEATTLREIMGFIVPPKEALDKSKKNIVGVWEWDMNGVWTEFNPSEQPVLEKAFQEFKKKGKTAAEVKFTIKAINKPYVANFSTMKQRNEASKFQRSIRRTVKQDVLLRRWEENRVDILEMYVWSSNSLPTIPQHSNTKQVHESIQLMERSKIEPHQRDETQNKVW